MNFLYNQNSSRRNNFSPHDCEDEQRYQKKYEKKRSRSRSLSKQHKKYRNSSEKPRHNQIEKNKKFSRSNSRKEHKKYKSDRYGRSSQNKNRNKYDSYRRKRSHSSHHKKKQKFHSSSHSYDRHDRQKKNYDTKKSYSSSSNSSSNRQQSDSKDRRKDAGHYKYKIGEKFNGEYKLEKFLADGTFGRVFEVKRCKDGKRYAMKVIRAVERYVESAKTETDIILYIQKQDPDDKYNHSRLIDSFHYGKNYCMVFEKLGHSLYDVIKMNEYRGFPIKYVQSFFKQILQSIGFLHSIKLTHTDLKPENILLRDNELIKKYENKSSEKSTSIDSNRENNSKQLFLPERDRIKIIDFGGATFDKDHHSSIINTRQYRSPEVILGCCQWDNLSDLWSIACIIIELYYGELLFPTHENYEHLAMIEKICYPIPQWMAEKAGNKLDSHFYKTTNDKGSYFDWPKAASSGDSVKRLKNLKTIEQIISDQNPEFRDLIHQCLQVDPRHRISCNRALEHPFFQVRYN